MLSPQSTTNLRSVGSQPPITVATCEQKTLKNCWQSASCKRFCEKLLINTQEQENCLTWPLDLFPELQKLEQNLQQSLFSQIEPNILNCFLKTLKTSPHVFFKTFKAKQAEEFLQELAFNHQLSQQLIPLDKQPYLVLKTLLKKLSTRPATALKKELGPEKENFLILISEYENDLAWDWLDDYIRYRCEKESHCSKPLDYYCEILASVSKSDQETLFSYRLFTRKYKKSIESHTCNRKPCRYGHLRDFKKLCQSL